MPGAGPNMTAIQVIDFIRADMSDCHSGLTHEDSGLGASMVDDEKKQTPETTVEDPIALPEQPGGERDEKNKLLIRQ